MMNKLVIFSLCSVILLLSGLTAAQGQDCWEKLRESFKELDQNKILIDSLIKQNDSLKDFEAKLKKAEEELEKSKGKMQKYNQMVNQNKKLQEKIDELKVIPEEKDKLQKQLEESETKASKLEEELRAIKQRVDRLNQDNTKLKDLEKRDRELTGELSETKKELTNIEEQAEQLKGFKDMIVQQYRKEITAFENNPECNKSNQVKVYTYFHLIEEFEGIDDNDNIAIKQVFDKLKAYNSIIGAIMAAENALHNGFEEEVVKNAVKGLDGLNRAELPEKIKERPDELAELLHEYCNYNSCSREFLDNMDAVEKGELVKNYINEFINEDPNSPKGKYPYLMEALERRIRNPLQKNGTNSLLPSSNCPCK